MQSNFVFVNYLSRSGSTFLCSELAKHPEICVGIEAGFPGFPDCIVPKKFDPIHDDDSLTHYLNLLFDDIRFKEWNIDREALELCLHRTGFPIYFSQIFNYCYDMANESDASKRVKVHKAGGFLTHYDRCQDLFPRSWHIFVLRDPRAIWNSQLNTDDLYSTGKMGIGLTTFIANYIRRVEQAVRLSETEKNVIIVKYEDLIQDLDRVISQLFERLGLENFSTCDDDSYQKKIPDMQKGLHRNVGGAPNKSLIDKWREKLKPHEISTIEFYLAKVMRKVGYDLSESPPSHLHISDKFMLRISLTFVQMRKWLKSNLIR